MYRAMSSQDDLRVATQRGVLRILGSSSQVDRLHLVTSRSLIRRVQIRWRCRKQAHSSLLDETNRDIRASKVTIRLQFGSQIRWSIIENPGFVIGNNSIRDGDCRELKIEINESQKTHNSVKQVDVSDDARFFGRKMSKIGNLVSFRGYGDSVYR
jgi:hypothetical protein